MEEFELANFEFCDFQMLISSPANISLQKITENGKL